MEVLTIVHRVALFDGRVIIPTQVQQTMERLYITKNWRTTAGVRLIFNPNAILKAEYSHNGEYGGIPGIPDDVITTSAVMAF